MRRATGWAAHFAAVGVLVGAIAACGGTASSPSSTSTHSPSPTVHLSSGETIASTISAPALQFRDTLRAIKGCDGALCYGQQAFDDMTALNTTGKTLANDVAGAAPYAADVQLLAQGTVTATSALAQAYDGLVSCIDGNGGILLTCFDQRTALSQAAGDVMTQLGGYSKFGLVISS